MQSQKKTAFRDAWTFPHNGNGVLAKQEEQVSRCFGSDDAIADGVEVFQRQYLARHADFKQRRRRVTHVLEPRSPKLSSLCSPMEVQTTEGGAR